MRTWHIVVVAGVLGSALGVGIAVARNRSCPWDGSPSGFQAPVEAPDESDSVPGGGPKAYVPEATYDFGFMDETATQKHDYVFVNKGTSALTLEKGETSCSCAVAELKKSKLLPGESGSVTLEWKAKGRKGPYRQTATILTNDPLRSRVTLTVSGRVASVLEVVPLEVVFSNVVSGESATQAVKLLCHKPDAFKIEGFDFSDLATADRFEVKAEPLTADELKKNEDAKSGYLLQVTAKPGLLLGPFQQTISARTNRKDVRTVPIPVKGMVVSDIAVVGRGWNEDTATLTLDAITAQDELERPLVLVVRGPFMKEVKFEVLKVEPDLLNVELGPTTPTKDGASTRTSMVVRIPRGSPPAEYLGTEAGKTGLIRIATHHPKAPELQLHVRFAVRN